MHPACSATSISASSTELILSIAALAACTWPYSSESSCSGWKTSASRPTAAISVPISIEPPPMNCAPAKSTAAVAIAPSNSIAGKKTE